MKHTTPHILLINPWITDFAAYNFWIKPLGLLYIANLLKQNGFRITFIDCLSLYSKVKNYGDGKFFKTKIEKPEPLKQIQRHFSQYGIPEEAFREKLLSVERPDLIGFTSGMTYWYPGLFKAIKITRDFYGNVPILLGGIYATLCYGHAKQFSGADYVVSGEGEIEALKLVSELIGMDIRRPGFDLSSISQQPSAINCQIYPAFDLYPKLDFVCILSSRGCPWKCTYCASHLLSKNFFRRQPIEVVNELEYWVTRHGVANIAFYDDALLIDPSAHIIPILREVIKRGLHCNFHAPNGLHAREINEEVAELLFLSGFKTIRLGLETSNETTQIETGGKIRNDELKRAIRNLRRVGYLSGEIGAYIMVGLPGQQAEEAEESIAFVREAGAKPLLAEYSPIPNTPMFAKARAMSPFDIEKEPLFQNNTIFPCQWKGFKIEDYKRLKEGLRKGKTYETI